jgi:hypothetical protein
MFPLQDALHEYLYSATVRLASSAVMLSYHVRFTPQPMGPG